MVHQLTASWSQRDLAAETCIAFRTVQLDFLWKDTPSVAQLKFLSLSLSTPQKLPQGGPCGLILEYDEEPGVSPLLCLGSGE